MKVNGNKVKKVVLLMSLLAPMVYLFGTLFEALKGSNGTITLAQEQEEFVPSSSYEESVNAPFAVNPYNADYVFEESSFVPSDVFGNSLVKDGLIVDSQPSALLSVGVNQWDEIVENGYYYIGGQADSSAYFRSKNFIRIKPNTTYYVKTPSLFHYFEYNLLKQDVFSSERTLNSGTFTTGLNSYYLRFYLGGTAYNNDICINISNPDFNGNYYPYVYRDYEISFPVLRSAGNAKDNLNKIYVGSVDLGTLTYDKKDGASVFTSTGLQSLIKSVSIVERGNLTCSLYNAEQWQYVYSSPTLDKSIAVNASGTIAIYDSDYNDSISFKSALSGVILNYELANPNNQLFVSIPSKLPIIKGGSVYVESNLVNDFQGEYFMYEGEYVLNSVSFSDYLFNQFFAEDNFLAASGRKVIDGTPDYGFKPAADLIRFTDSNMFHLANVEYGALVIGYTYYAFHVVCVFLIFNLLMFFPHLIENVYEKFERGW